MYIPYIPYVLLCHTCLVVLLVFVFHVRRTLRALVSRVVSLHAFVLYLPLTERGLVPLVLYFLQVSHTQQTLMHIMSYSSRISCLLRFLYFSYFIFFYPSATVNQHGIKLLLKKSCYISFFIGDISLQDPLTYDDLTVMIYQPEFVR